MINSVQPNATKLNGYSILRSVKLLALRFSFPLTQ